LALISGINQYAQQRGNEMPSLSAKYLVVRRDATIPKWPAFVLGARDPAAPAALRAYAKAAREMGMEEEYVQNVISMADEFEQYRAAEGAGDPDNQSQRFDDAAVIEAMRGEPGSITVHTDSFNAVKGFDSNVRRRL
jgi:hypothetical protein